MKKLFTLFTLMVCAVMAHATDYTDNLIVNMGGEDIANQEATISIDKQDNGQYTLSLRNFTMGTVKVGTIIITDVEGTEQDGNIVLKAEKDVTIQKGDTGFGWIMAGQEVPILLNATIYGDKLYAEITINMLGGINVIFGTKPVSGITGATSNSTKAEYFDLNGRRVNAPTSGKVYIKKTAGGKATKVIL